MATGNCWQIGKSLAESNKHMMESHLGADVEFCVGNDLTSGELCMQDYFTFGC